MSGFIPKQYKKEPVTVRIGMEKLKKLDDIAYKFDMSRSELINQCIDYAIEHIENLPEKVEED